MSFHIECLLHKGAHGRETAAISVNEEHTDEGDEEIVNSGIDVKARAQNRSDEVGEEGTIREGLGIEEVTEIESSQTSSDREEDSINVVA